MQDENIQKLKEIMLSESPILFLGAGFSLGAANEYGEMPTGQKLKNEIIKKFVQGTGSEDEDEELASWNLDEICEYVNNDLNMSKELKAYLVSRFQNIQPAQFHYLLTRYPWKKIYTVNIDDLVERVYRDSGKDLVVQNKKEKKIVDSEKVEYIKLHGCVHKPDEQLVFSKSEYTDLITSKLGYRHNDFVLDIQNRNVIFVGANLDEWDIDCYLTIYEKAGYQRSGSIFFIDPNPNRKLISRVKKLGGFIIEWTAECFLHFVEDLKFNPTALEQRKRQLNYSGIFLIRETLNSYSDENYESRLYEGYNSNWQDVKYDWLFSPTICKKLYERLDNIDFKNNNCFCLALYGNRFSGKDCILKLLGIYLDKKGYEVLEYRGKKFSIETVKNYIKTSPKSKFALLIENASYYYKTIEKIMNINLEKKEASSVCVKNIEASSVCVKNIWLFLQHISPDSALTTMHQAAISGARVSAKQSVSSLAADMVV